MSGQQSPRQPEDLRNPLTPQQQERLLQQYWQVQQERQEQLRRQQVQQQVVPQPQAQQFQLPGHDVTDAQTQQQLVAQHQQWRQQTTTLGITQQPPRPVRLSTAPVYPVAVYDPPEQGPPPPALDIIPASSFHEHLGQFRLDSFMTPTQPTIRPSQSGWVHPSIARRHQSNIESLPRTAMPQQPITTPRKRTGAQLASPPPKKSKTMRQPPVKWSKRVDEPWEYIGSQQKDRFFKLCIRQGKFDMDGRKALWPQWLAKTHKITVDEEDPAYLAYLRQQRKLWQRETGRPVDESDEEKAAEEAEESEPEVAVIEAQPQSLSTFGLAQDTGATAGIPAPTATARTPSAARSVQPAAAPPLSDPRVRPPRSTLHAARRPTQSAATVSSGDSVAAPRVPVPAVSRPEVLVPVVAEDPGHDAGWRPSRPFRPSEFLLRANYERLTRLAPHSPPLPAGIRVPPLAHPQEVTTRGEENSRSEPVLVPPEIPVFDFSTSGLTGHYIWPELPEVPRSPGMTQVVPDLGPAPASPRLPSQTAREPIDFGRTWTEMTGTVPPPAPLEGEGLEIEDLKEYDEDGYWDIEE